MLQFTTYEKVNLKQAKSFKDQSNVTKSKKRHESKNRRENNQSCVSQNNVMHFTSLI